MSDQRVFTIATPLIMILFAAGCGAQPHRVPDSNTAEPPLSESTSAEDAPGQLIVDLPPEIREVGSPDITVPVPPAKENSESSTQSGSESLHEAPGNGVGSIPNSGGEVAEPWLNDPPHPSDSAAANAVENGKSEVTPKPPNPRPAGSIPVAAEEKADSSTPLSTETRKIVIQRDGVPKEHKGFSSELVYFATNREPSAGPGAESDPDLYFGDNRGDLSYGICRISIPYRRTPGTLPEPSIWSLEFTQDPQKHVVLMEIQRLPDAEFWMALRKKVEDSPNRQLMLFVHGYCATFRDAARRTAQMSYDMNYQGAAMFFSWPAGSDLEGIQERANYLKDLRRAEESDEDLIAVIQNISRWSGAERIHVVAHSMGSFILTEALKTIDDRNGGKGEPPEFFDQMVMAAPDLDARGFVKSSGKRLRGFSRRTTVYASKQDKALKISRSVNGFEPLGLLNEFSRQGAEARLYELVDASTAESGWFDSGHVYYGDMPEMLIDLAFVFRGVPASSLQRGLGETPPLYRLSSRSR